MLLIMPLLLTFFFSLAPLRATIITPPPLYLRCRRRRRYHAAIYFTLMPLRQPLLLMPFRCAPLRDDDAAARARRHAAARERVYLP